MNESQPKNQQFDPLEQWKTDFGSDYRSRNQLTADRIGQARTVFDRIFKIGNIEKKFTSILEVGANVGINLSGIRRLEDGKTLELHALEPNEVAVGQLRENHDLALSSVLHSDAYSIAAPDGAYDLVFTNGVLIHVPPARLDEALREIHRVSRRYILCSEYFSHTPQEVVYRGKEGMLWKRDFGKAYKDQFPDLRCLATGFLWLEEFPQFDNLNWWLFEKSF